MNEATGTQPVDADCRGESDKDDHGRVSPHTHKAVTEATTKVAKADRFVRDAKHAGDAALELNCQPSAQNERFRAAESFNVAKDADAELQCENDRLKQQVIQLQNKVVRSDEVSFISAKVLDSRITKREGRKFVEYKLQIETDTRGTLYVWHRYSTFRDHVATLQTKYGYKREEIPKLPNKQLFGNFSEKLIQERVAKLNQFLETATKAEHLQWGIRVDQDTLACKRRVKNQPSREVMNEPLQDHVNPNKATITHKHFADTSMVDIPRHESNGKPKIPEMRGMDSFIIKFPVGLTVTVSLIPLLRCASGAGPICGHDSISAAKNEATCTHKHRVDANEREMPRGDGNGKPIELCGTYSVFVKLPNGFTATAYLVPAPVDGSTAVQSDGASAAVARRCFDGGDLRVLATLPTACSVTVTVTCSSCGANMYSAKGSNSLSAPSVVTFRERFCRSSARTA